MVWRQMKRVAEDAVVASAASAGLIFAGWLSLGVYPVVPVLAQAIGVSTMTPASESLMEFALRQGGAFAVLIIVLFYYRRDYRDLTAYKDNRDNQMVEMVREQTKANSEMAAALRENNIIVHQAKNVLRDYVPLPTRRMEDQRGTS